MSQEILNYSFNENEILCLLKKNDQIQSTEY